jgi:hypothetical protein
MDALGAPQVSGTFAVSAGAPGSIVVRVPVDALQPAMVAIRNTHATAILYLKWMRQGATNPAVSAGDCGILLNPGEGFIWDRPPAGAMLVALSTVANSPLCVDAHWRVLDEALL